VPGFTDNEKNLSSLLLSSNFYQRRCDKARPKNVLDFQNLIDQKFESSKPLNIFLDGRSACKIFDAHHQVSPGPNVTIYIHRTDLIPSRAQMEHIRSLNFQIKSVNWLGSSDICQPIPIGIPPETFDGELGRIISSSLSSYQNNSESRKRFKYYLNFDITTNIVLRKKVLEIFHDRKDVFFPARRLSVSQHLEAIRSSKYVLSPSGAGPDCYRTWETLYLGSTPVVLKRHWPFPDAGLPVLGVDSYEDFLIDSEYKDLSFNFQADRQFAINLSRRFG
jgi:hypothetical protein